MGAIYARLDTAAYEEARTWLAARTPIEREVIAFLLSLRLLPPDHDADPVALLALDERVLYGRLKMATPEFRARFANYLQIRDACRTGERALAMLRSFEPDARFSVDDSV